MSARSRSRAPRPQVWPLRERTRAGCPDRKSTRLNSSHSQISYAAFCLKKKNIDHVLASMRALLADATLEELFFQRYAERELMHYALLDNENQGHGPIILSVDAARKLR